MLAVVGLVMGGIWAAVSTVQENLTAKRIAEGLLFIKNGVQSDIPSSIAVGYTTSSGNILQRGITHTTLANMGIIPKDWVETSGRARLPTGHNMIIFMAEYGGAPISVISVISGCCGEPNFKPSLCIKVLRLVLPSDIKIQVEVNGSYAYANIPSTRTLSHIKNICMNNGSTTINGMSFSFPLTRIN